MNSLTRNDQAARVSLCKRLRGLEPDIEQAALARLSAISDLGGGANRVDGTHQTVAAAIDFGISTISRDAASVRAPRDVLLCTCRAARNRVSLDNVFRLYFAGYSVFTDFVLTALRQERLADQTAATIVRSHAVSFDGLLQNISIEYSRELNRCRTFRSEGRLRHVKSLLACESLDISDLSYDFDLHHIGLIGSGPSALRTVSSLARLTNLSVLSVQAEPDIVWAWLGSDSPSADPRDILRKSQLPAGSTWALGEPAPGLSGWRLTHRQALTAFSTLPVAAANGAERAVAHYEDVALLASLLKDDLIQTSLQTLYLRPLESVRDGGRLFRKTLRAYFAANRNVSSAAAALGVSRQTVANRLSRVEALLGRHIPQCATEIEAALRLDQALRQPS